MPTRKRIVDLYRTLFPKVRIRYVIRRRRARPKGKRARLHYESHKEAARVLVHAKLAKFNEHYKFTYQRVAIRDQKSRWGSCSKKGNLNFNYRLLFLSEELVDAVIVHELCHLREFNHSSNFWDLVAETIPDHLRRRKQLARISVHTLTKLRKESSLPNKQ